MMGFCPTILQAEKGGCWVVQGEVWEESHGWKLLLGRRRFPKSRSGWWQPARPSLSSSCSHSG